MGRGDERVLRMALRNVLRATSHEDALGVTRGCPAADVTEAYRDMAILCHPDKVAAGLRGDAGVAMSRLNAARDALSNSCGTCKRQCRSAIVSAF